MGAGTLPPRGQDCSAEGSTCATQRLLDAALLSSPLVSLNFFFSLLPDPNVSTVRAAHLQHIRRLRRSCHSIRALAHAGGSGRCCMLHVAMASSVQDGTYVTAAVQFVVLVVTEAWPGCSIYQRGYGRLPHLSLMSQLARMFVFATAT